MQENLYGVEMKIEYDQEKSETILHLDAEEMGNLLFAVYAAGVNTNNPKYQDAFETMHREMQEGMEK
jgi:hypothetical protein